MKFITPINPNFPIAPSRVRAIERGFPVDWLCERGFAPRQEIAALDAESAEVLGKIKGLL